MMETFLTNFLSDWAADAVIDSVKTVPFLFFVFVFIELFEHFWADKIRIFLKTSKKQGPVIGAIAASIPQCGFSVIASTLYTNGFITRGTIVAVYLATSDEAIPVLLMYPEYISYILPLIILKLLIAVPVGYLTDCIFKKPAFQALSDKEEIGIEGCHRHEITAHGKRDFFIHPIKHTLGVFIFILFLTLLLNYLMQLVDFATVFETKFAILTPVLTALFGLIPNCAVSVGLVLMFIKGAIPYGAMVSGLMSSSGIGLLILFKNNKSKKDIFLILGIIFIVSCFSGLLIQILS